MQAGAPFFMDPDNAGISAVIGYSSDRSETPLLTADVVHNHLAEQQVGQGLLGPDNTEWGKVSDIGRYCCKSRKSNGPRNLAKVDLRTFLLLRRFSAPPGRSVIDFG
jgi:hypothetical protein